MKPLPPDEMTEATRLTRSGRLNEAVALIQRMLRGGQTGANAETDSSAASPLSLTALTLYTPSGQPASKALPDLPRVLGALNFDIPALRGLGGRRAPQVDIAPSVGTFLAKSFSNAAGTRAYKLYVPSRHGDDPRPLVVMLHGCTQSA